MSEKLSAQRSVPTLVVAIVAMFAPAMAVAQPSASAPVELRREQLCVTNGEVTSRPGGHLAVETPSSRGVARLATPQEAEIRFHYLGPTRDSKPLASGELRRQIGLKLRAQDTCNLVYVMWHIEPDSRIAVSVKRNPGQHTHEQCDAKGYLNVRPRKTIPLAKVLEGETHELHATLTGAELCVEADRKTVWEGQLEPHSLDFEGPAGFRTDNARFEFEFLVSPGGGSPVDQRLNPCVTSAGD